MRSMSMAIYEYSQNCGNAKHEAVLILKTYTFWEYTSRVTLCIYLAECLTNTPVLTIQEML